MPDQETVLQGSKEDNLKGVMGVLGFKTEEVARQQWKELVVWIYIYEEDQGHEVCNMEGCL